MNVGGVRKETGKSTEVALRSLQREVSLLRKILNTAIRNGYLVVPHDELRHLAYADAGHTGFASSASLSSHTGDSTLHQKRTIVVAFGDAAITGDQYLYSNDMITSASAGYIVPRAGSITAMSAVAVDGLHTTDGTLAWEARVNGTAVLSITSDTITAGITVSDYVTQATGTDVVAVGDVVSGYVNFDDYVGTCHAAVFIEITFD